jgi:hypothetical protein
MTTKVLEEIYFYDKVEPFRLLRGNVFEGKGFNNKGQGEDEHVISICLDISWKGHVYRDTFEWDIMNPANVYHLFNLDLKPSQSYL